MGWSGGSELMETIIKGAKKHIKDKKARKSFYKPIVAAFEDHDCDTLYECEGLDPVFDEFVATDEGDDE